MLKEIISRMSRNKSFDFRARLRVIYGASKAKRVPFKE